MSTISNGEQSNRDLISALSESSSQPYVPSNQSIVSALLVHNIQPSSAALVVQTPSGAAAAAGMTFNPPIQATVATSEQAFLETIVKLQSILNR